MTVRLRVQYGTYPPNTNISTGAAEETRLLRTGQADTNTGAGVAYVAPVVTDYNVPLSIEARGYPATTAGGRILLSAAAADNADGLPDGTIYIQTAS